MGYFLYDSLWCMICFACQVNPGTSLPYSEYASADLEDFTRFDENEPSTNLFCFLSLE